MSSNQKSVLSLFVVHALGVLFALALSTNSTVIAGVPSPMWLVFGAFAIPWVMFIPAYAWQTEKFFDLTGSATYMSVAVVGLLLANKLTPTQFVVATCTAIWAGRLGWFLFSRIREDGKDGRFDDIKPSFFRFLNVWSIQGLWVTITAACVIAVLTTQQTTQNHALMWLGLLVWVAGFAVEVIADQQKKAFRADVTNQGKFIQTGLWARSRHPNYFGEITLWLGVAIMAIPVLASWQWLALSSPVVVFLLLNYVSGIPLLEKRADEKWGTQEDYQQYKRNTPVLVPALRRS